MKNEIATILERVRKWPKERQDDAAEILKLIKDHDKSPYGLTVKRAAKVRRRLAADASYSVTLTQLDERLRLLGI
jgi:hypothetical protein